MIEKPDSCSVVIRSESFRSVTIISGAPSMYVYVYKDMFWAIWSHRDCGVATQTFDFHFFTHVYTATCFFFYRSTYLCIHRLITLVAYSIIIRDCVLIRYYLFVSMSFLAI